MQITHTNQLAPLLSEGLLKINGQGAKALLQGQLTCDLEHISHTQSSLAALCNPKGRVISLFQLYLIEDDYYLQMPINLIEITVNHLKKYAVFYKATLEDVSQQFHIMGGLNLKTTALSLPTTTNQVIGHEQIIITRLAGQQARYTLIGSVKNLEQQIEMLFSKPMIGTEDQWKKAQLDAGISSIYRETSELFLPHDLNLHSLNAISFQKGCYTGQEIIARMEYRGKSKNTLSLTYLKSLNQPVRGAGVYADSTCIGYIVDFCYLDYHKFELLIIIQESKASTTHLYLDEEQTILLSTKDITNV